jgi:heme-degrading monooxygenase HmoA
MHHVIFEVLPAAGARERYLALAARLRPMLESSGGCLALERFERDDDAAGWMLSMQRWADAAALARWRMHGEHGKAQASGRAQVFADYRLRVATRSGQQATRAAERALAGDGAPALDAAGDALRALAVLEWTGPADALGALVPPDALRYTAILDPARRALVTANAPARALRDWCERAVAALAARGLPYAASLASVERDYGMFDRAEAPPGRG